MKVIQYLGTAILGGLAFYAGTIVGSMVARLLGLSLPPLPSGVNTDQLLLLSFLASIILAGALGFVSLHLSGGFLSRWLALFFLSWIAYGVNTFLEAAIFTTMTGPAVVVLYLFSSLFCAAVIAAFLHPQEQGENFIARTKSFFAGRTPFEWTWRLLLSFLAFPFAYILFGLMVQPFTYEFYAQQKLGLIAPGWGQILPVLAVRSSLFLLVILPVLITWTGSRPRLFVTLGSVLFLLVGGLSLLQAIWYPPIIRIAHGLEILADSFAHTALVVYLLVQEQRS